MLENDGNRLETYVIKGKRGSGEVCINGAAAHLVNKGDLVCTPPYEIHAIKIIKKNKLLEFSNVIRTKKKYRNDIIRIKIV